MKIIQLSAENIKKLKVVDITPTKDFIQISGANGSGKTSILDSIWWALGGAEAMEGQSAPIRSGEQKAVIRVDLGEMVVIRRFTPSGTTLVVESSNGFRAPKPQAMLDAIIGHITFDPLEFSRMDAKKQFDALKQIAEVNIDFDALAKDDKEDREKRAELNREIKNLDGQIVGITIPDDAPTEHVSVTDLMKELGDLEDHNTVVMNNEQKREQYQARLTTLGDKKTELQRALAEVEDAIIKGGAALDALPIMEGKPTDGIKAKIAGAEAINKAVADRQRKADLIKRREALHIASEGYTEALQKRNDHRQKSMEQAKMPITGLSLGDGEVHYNSIPFAQLSSAEQLRVSVAIAMAANPKLKVIRIKDGSLLDDNSLKMIQDLAHDREYQVWCEKVDTTGKVGIVMEDGQIAAVNE